MFAKLRKMIVMKMLVMKMLKEKVKRRSKKLRRNGGVLLHFLAETSQVFSSLT